MNLNWPRLTSDLRSHFGLFQMSALIDVFTALIAGLKDLVAF